MPGDLDAAIGGFFREQPRVGASVPISIDGKTLKGTIDSEDPHSTHLLVAYLPEEGIVLLQLPAGHEENVISVALALLRALDLRGRIVAADGLRTQRELSVQILAAGGEYLFLAKDNQPTLREEIELLFSGDDRTVDGGKVVHELGTVRRVNEGHRRREVRQITGSSELGSYSDRPGLEQVFRLDRYRITGRKRRARGRLRLTSLTPAEASPSRSLELTRAYWGVDTGLHYRRDVTFREDATRLMTGQAGQVMAALNNLIIGLLRLAGFTNLAAARRYCDAGPTNALARLSSTTRQ